MTETPAGASPESRLIDEADADRRRAPELDLSQQAYPTAEQNKRALSNPKLAVSWRAMLNRREDARVKYLEDCARRSGVSWSGLGDVPVPAVLSQTFDELLEEAEQEQAREAAYAISPRGVLDGQIGVIYACANRIHTLTAEIDSCVSRGLAPADLEAASTRLGEIRRKLAEASFAASKVDAVLDVIRQEERS